MHMGVCVCVCAREREREREVKAIRLLLFSLQELNSRNDSDLLAGGRLYH